MNCFLRSTFFLLLFCGMIIPLSGQDLSGQFSANAVNLQLNDLYPSEKRAIFSATLSSENRFLYPAPTLENYTFFDKEHFSSSYVNTQTPWFDLSAQHPLNVPTLAISAVGIGYGFLAQHVNPLTDIDYSIRHDVVTHHADFHTIAGDYLKYAPAVAMVGLKLAGFEGKHSLAGEIAIYGAAALLDAAVITEVKSLTKRQRPDFSNDRSFPSGHTGAAFVAAEVLRIEYGDESPWIGIAGYAVAASVGALRIYNNRHWFSDVIAGAATGFLCTHIVYAIVPWIEQHILRPHQKGNVKVSLLGF